MKKNYFIPIFICFTTLSFSQETLVLKPDAIVGRDAVIYSNSVDGHDVINFGTLNDFMACAWTFTGNEANVRGLIHFDLSQIPAGSVITSAHLNLFFNPISVNDGHSTLSGSNACLLQRITSPWDEMTVTWVTQPTTTTSGQVLIPATTNNTQDYGNIDVTGLIDYFYNNPSQNYGLMLRQQTEEHYRSMLFASSDHTDPALWPELVINYTANAGITETSEELIRWVNYASQILTLSLDAAQVKYVEIYTISGEKVFEYIPGFTEGDQLIMQLPHLTFGTYILNVYGTDGQTRVSEKIVLH